eukprot:3483843-Rhodomonas_salina.1
MPILSVTVEEGHLVKGGQTAVSVHGGQSATSAHSSGQTAIPLHSIYTLVKTLHARKHTVVQPLYQNRRWR